MAVWRLSKVLTLTLVAAASAGTTHALPGEQAAARTSAGATQLKRFEPFDSDGEIRADLDYSTRRGDCNSSSFRDGRGDAWRCFVGSRIYDPCFEVPAGDDTVFCIQSPWDTSGVRVRSPLNSTDRYDDGPRIIWALALRGGKRCVFASGATTAAGKHRLNYFCGRTFGRPFLFGNPDRSHAVWRIRAARTPEGVDMHWRKIHAAWR